MSAPGPRILGILCETCAYAAADRAGAASTELPAGFRTIRVPCTGEIAPELVLAAFAEGADGVLLLGCHFGDCAHGDGNRLCFTRHRLLSRVLADLGIAPERCRFDVVSAREPEKLAGLVLEMDDALRATPPRPRG